MIRNVLLAILLALAVPAAARDLTAPQRAALSETVAGFDAAMVDMDMARVLDTVPPRIFRHIAEQAGVDVETLRAMVAEQSAAALAQVTLVSFGMDVDAAEALATPDGTPYVLIPTETVMETGGQRLRATGHTLAMMDEGQWYLLRVSERTQVTILRAVYPAFAEVVLPEGRIEAVE